MESEFKLADEKVEIWYSEGGSRMMNKTTSACFGNTTAMRSVAGKLKVCGI